MIDLAKISNIKLLALINVLSDDLGRGFLSLLTGVDETNSTIQISTQYAKYLISVIDSEKNSFSVTTEGNNVIKTVLVNKDALDAEPIGIKYFLRRQFVADEELFNVHLWEGKEIPRL